MKIHNVLRLGIALIILICGSSGANAAIGTLYGANLSASLTTQTGSNGSTTVTVHTVHINNKSIIENVFATGTTGALKSSDLALVFNDSVSLEVINTTSTNNQVVAMIATTGTNSSDNAIAPTTKSGLLALTEAVSDYEFTIPTVPNVQQTNIRVTADANLTTFLISKAFISFNGGYGTDISGATFFQGTVRQTGKKY